VRQDCHEDRSAASVAPLGLSRRPPAPAGRTTGKAQKTRLKVQVFFVDTGEEKETFAAPYQKPAYQGIQVHVRDSNGDGVAGQVMLTAIRGKKKVTAIVPA
jgi:hypothetical protein